MIRVRNSRIASHSAQYSLKLNNSRKFRASKQSQIILGEAKRKQQTSFNLENGLPSHLVNPSLKNSKLDCLRAPFKNLSLRASMPSKMMSEPYPSISGSRVLQSQVVGKRVDSVKSPFSDLQSSTDLAWREKEGPKEPANPLIEHGSRSLKTRTRRNRASLVFSQPQS